MSDRVENDRSAHRRQPERGATDPYDEQPPQAAPPIRAALGSQTESPRWSYVSWRVFVSIFEHRLLTTSGGVAFFALLAIFPALATIVSLYSLFADPHAIPARVALLAGVVPESIIDLIKQEIQSLAEKNMSTLSAAFLVGLLVSIWSANSGVSALFDALNIVHGETEQRSLLRFYATTFAVTLGAVVYGLVAIVGLLTMALKSLGLGESPDGLSAMLRWPATLLLVMIWLSIVYRVGPSRSDAKWRWVTWGSGLAGVLLVVASMVFGWYLAEFNSYDRLYGSLGAVVGFMTWLWISVVVMLLGAELDAALEANRAGGTDWADSPLNESRSGSRASQQLIGRKPALRGFFRDPFLSVSGVRADAKFSHFGLDPVSVIASGMAARSEKSTTFNALDGAEELCAVFGFQVRPARSTCRRRRHEWARKKPRALGVCAG